MAILNEINKAVTGGHWQNIGNLVQQALDSGVDPLEIFDRALNPAMTEVGDKFSSGELFMPDMLLAAKTMKTAMEVLKPHLVGNAAADKGTVVIGTLQGDLHDIGKNMVISMLEGAGYKCVDLGIDAPPEKFISAIKNNNADVVGFSGLLTTTLAGIPNYVRALKDAGLWGKVITIVGGAPVTDDFARRNEIDLYAPDSSIAVKVISSAVKNRGKK